MFQNKNYFPIFDWKEKSMLKKSILRIPLLGNGLHDLNVSVFGWFELVCLFGVLSGMAYPNP